ncbi:DUF2272 domain-containing protein [Noviherbaspirillum saxi]|nr:DUF2272 domain-containing protein [Noviherbaspirillum saxi]
MNLSKLPGVIFLALSLSIATVSAATNCRSAAPNIAAGSRLAELADRELREFNGHRIGDDGHILKFGSIESENELLHDVETGVPSGNVSGRFAWRRVWEYWIALGKHVDGEPLHRKLVFVPGLLGNANSSARAREVELSTLLVGIGGDGDADIALREAAVRAALNDSPWSAAFIAYVMNQAGLRREQFQYSATHSDYIKAAFHASDTYAYRACDPVATMPRVGDLLCYSRGNKPLKTYSAWEAAVQDQNFISASHCEVVVDVDVGALKIETIGGNVLQSVARRKLRLNERGVLSRNHSPDAFPPADDNNCLIGKACKRQNFNRQYWSVLLQLK